MIFNYNFEWDSRKARQNWLKHGVLFQEAATVFNDPRALSIYDESHSGAEDRWLTIGIAATGRLLVVHHTYEEVDQNTVRIRMISSRKAARHEAKEYAE